MRESVMPIPEKGQVLVRMRANSLNYRDLMVARGVPVGVPIRTGLIPLSDGAGEVVALGEGVTLFAVGDRVVTCFRQCADYGHSAGAARDLGGGIDGVLREYAAFDEVGLVHLPEYLSYEQGSTLTCAGLTAWNAVMSKGCLRVGQTILIQGTGGVSLFALQLAKASGARVIAITSNTEKEYRLRALGADATVNYRTYPEWYKEVLALTGGQGVDLVVEVSGAATFAQSIGCTRVGGRMVLVGARGGMQEYSLGGVYAALFVREINLGSVRVGSRQQFEQLINMLQVSRIQPVIDRTFSFAQALDAYRYLQQGNQVGKVVISHA